METKRLTIRFIEESDWEAVRKIWTDFDRSKYVIYDEYKPTDPVSMKRRISRWAKANETGTDHLFFASCLEEEVIGFVSMNRTEDGYEMGYGFRTAYQGKGYGKETVAAVLEYMRERGARKITAGTALRNEPSVALLRSLGFEMTGTETVAFYKDSSGNPLSFEGGIFELELKKSRHD